MSRRKEIRTAIKRALIGKTSAGERVFSNLSSSLWREELPQIVVFSRSEDVTEMNVAPREYRRILELAIEVVAEGSEDPNSGVYVEDTLDDIAEQIEMELNRDETLGEIENALGKNVALIDSLVLNNVEFDFAGEGAKPTGSARLIYNVTYHEFRPGNIEEQAGIGEFNKIHAEWKIGHNDSAPDSVVEATDDLTLPD